MKVVINACHGGFGLSDAAIRRYAERKGITLYPEQNERFKSMTTWWTVPPDKRPVILDGAAWHVASMDERKASNEAHSASTFYGRDIPRDDADLVAVVEEMGDAASGQYGKLKVVEVPDDVAWEIAEYDGYEHVAEQYRTWA